MEELQEKKAELLEFIKEELGSETFGIISERWNTENTLLNQNLCAQRSEGLCILLSNMGVSQEHCVSLVEFIVSNEQLMSIFNLLYLCLDETGGIHIYPEKDFVLLRDIIFGVTDEILLGLLEKLLGSNRLYFTLSTKDQAQVMYELSIMFVGIMFGKTLVNPQYVDRAEYAEDMPGKDAPEIHLHEYIRSQGSMLQTYFANAA